MNHSAIIDSVCQLDPGSRQYHKGCFLEALSFAGEESFKHDKIVELDMEYNIVTKACVKKGDMVGSLQGEITSRIRDNSFMLPGDLYLRATNVFGQLVHSHSKGNTGNVKVDFFGRVIATKDIYINARLILDVEASSLKPLVLADKIRDVYKHVFFIVDKLTQ